MLIRFLSFASCLHNFKRKFSHFSELKAVTMFHVEDLPRKNFKTFYQRVTPLNPIKIRDVTIEPRSGVLAKGIVQNLESIANFPVRDDDVWVVTYPKSGTTWTQEMCWLILNDFDFKGAKEVDIGERSPFLEFSSLYEAAPVSSIDKAKSLKSPRLLKSHIPLPFLPKGLWTTNAKVVYTARDPRDAAASLYHHTRKWCGKDVEKESFLKTIIDDDIIYSPYWDHVLEFWKLRDNPNVFFLTYEEMKENLEAVIERVCKFLNKPITKEQMINMVVHLSFDSMRRNDACQHNYARNQAKLEVFDKDHRFVRRGVVGSFKDEFSPDLLEVYNGWMKKNLTKTDFEFYKV